MPQINFEEMWDKAQSGETSPADDWDLRFNMPAYGAYCHGAIWLKFNEPKSPPLIWAHHDKIYHLTVGVIPHLFTADEQERFLEEIFDELKVTFGKLHNQYRRHCDTVASLVIARRQALAHKDGRNREVPPALFK